MAPDDFRIRRIGILRTPWTRQEGTPIQGHMAPEAEGVVEMDPEYTAGLADVDGFSHLVLLYWLHRSEGFELRIQPYLDGRKRGVFSTRAPRRPNPIGLTVVRLLEVDGPRIRVSGVDMLDGTPLIDIKPFIPDLVPSGSVSCGWLDRVRKEDGKLPKKRADDRFEPGSR
ncbi:MAG: tRNA (N6-threonylcarbamoyladenosine(37)-N6)-methyltransferase TrmO [Deltaproteobacteria bacterium]|nr:tRNA (N6-threonylcarbamoyladenosine(37)-N6)-methyltransferase TrmO [Deltaproteobacteria bacterium]